MKEIEQQFISQMASAKAEMQKLFKVDERRPATANGQKENPTVPETPAKDQSEYDEFQSGMKEKTAGKSKMADK